MVPRVARMRPAKAVAHQLRQQAAMVDMGMGQQHGIDVGRAKRKGAVVQLLQGLLSLKQAAIDQEAPGLASRTDSTSPSPCAPRRKTGWLRSSGFSAVGCAHLAARRRRTVRRARWHWWNAGRCGSNGSSECRLRAISRQSCFRKQRVRDDGVDRRRAGGVQRLGAGDHGAAGRDDVVDDQGGTAGNACRVRKSDLDGAVAAPGLLRDRMGEAEPVRRGR